MNFEPFNQAPPTLGNQYAEDRVLRGFLRQTLPADVLVEITPALHTMGELAGGDLYQQQLADRLNEPRLTQWSAWGERIDAIEVSPLWQRAERLAAEAGVVAAAYEKRYGRYDRLHQFALAYLFHASTDIYTCPLAMTDGAARTLLLSGNRPLIERAVPHLTSRDPRTFWTSGQWMTESTGGSDVGRSETVAHCEDGVWRLYGRKWFTSATTSQMALTLARPEGNPAGGKGLALFYVETRDANNRLQDIRVNRLKDKLGTRKVPTAELMLEGVRAELVLGDRDGVKNIVPMLHLTRTWNSVSAVAMMRRGLVLARSYAQKRIAFDKPLAQQPLHTDTLARLQAEMEGAFHLTFYLVGLIGREEAGELTEPEHGLLRLLTSIVKLTTAKQAVAVLSEVLEAHGGAGYVEDTGLPMLLRDAQVLPIWEGTTNVLALDALKALAHGDTAHTLLSHVQGWANQAQEAQLQKAGQVAVTAVTHALDWLAQGRSLEAGARRLALTLGRATALALLVAHAQWAFDTLQDGRPRLAALCLAQAEINGILETAVDGLEALTTDAT